MNCLLSWTTFSNSDMSLFNYCLQMENHVTGYAIPRYISDCLVPVGLNLTNCLPGTA